MSQWKPKSGLGLLKRIGDMRVEIETRSARFWQVFSVLLLVFVVSASPVWASGFGLKELHTMDRLEEQLFETSYSKENPHQRLKRLEETIFGQSVESSDVQDRIQRLQQVLQGITSPAAKANQPTPQENTGYYGGSSSVPSNGQGNGYSSGSQRIEPDYVPPTPYASAPSSGQKGASSGASATGKLPNESDYPTVTAMEQRFFNRTYQGDDVVVRLNRLENRVFNQTQPGALFERVERLWIATNGTADRTAVSMTPEVKAARESEASRPVVYSQDGMSAAYPPDGGYAGQSADTSLGTPFGTNSGANSADFMGGLAEVEQQVLSTTYPTEPAEFRLARLEQKIFGSESPELSPDERLNRVIAVAAAGGDEFKGGQGAVNGQQSVMRALIPIILTILPMLLL